jgi:hypothetical protein
MQYNHGSHVPLLKTSPTQGAHGFMLAHLTQVLDALLATERELFNRGGFLPLMAVAPTVHQARAQKWKYCAHPLDDHVRRYTATRV